MKVNFYATLRAIAGTKTVEFDTPDGVTAETLLADVLARYPAMRAELYDKDGTLRPHVHLFLDGKSVHHLDGGVATLVKEGAKIDLFPAVAGG